MNIMKKLLSVFVVLAMLLSFAACDSSKKKDDDDEDEDESGEAVELNNDFEGTYEGEISLLDVYCFALEYPKAEAEDFAADMDDYTATATLNIKDDTFDMSFECSSKDIKKFVNDFYTAVAESMFDEDEVESQLADAADHIEDEIDALEEYFADSEDKDIDYTFDGESAFEFSMGGADFEFELDLGTKKFTVKNVESSASDYDDFCDIFEDVTFKKVANYEGGKKDDDDDKKDESKDENKPENKPGFAPNETSKDESKNESTFVPVPVLPDETPAEGITGTYAGVIYLLDAYYIMNEFEDDVYAADEYMEHIYYLDVTLTITDSTITFDIIEEPETVDAFLDEFAYALLAYYYPDYTEEQVQAAIAAIADDIAGDKAALKTFIEEIYFYNCGCTYDEGSEVISIDVYGNTMNISIIIDDTTGDFEIYSVYDDNFENIQEFETLLYSTVFTKQ